MPFMIFSLSMLFWLFEIHPVDFTVTVPLFFPAPVHSCQHPAPRWTGPSVYHRPPAVRHQR